MLKQRLQLEPTVSHPSQSPAWCCCCCGTALLSAWSCAAQLWWLEKGRRSPYPLMLSSDGKWGCSKARFCERRSLVQPLWRLLHRKEYGRVASCHVLATPEVLWGFYSWGEGLPADGFPHQPSWLCLRSADCCRGCWVQVHSRSGQRGCYSKTRGNLG